MQEKSVKLPRIKIQKRSDIVYKILYKEIVSGTYPPGYQLDLNSIEKQLGISRTPLKLALHRLELEGLIEIKPQYGTFVTTPNPKQIKETFAVRMMIETFIIEEVIERMTNSDFSKLNKIIEKLNTLEESNNLDEIYIRLMEIDRHFHRSLVKLSGNHTIIRIYDSVNIYPHITRLLFHIKERDLKIAQKEHAAIIEGLRRRDVAFTKEAIIAHCRRSEQSTLSAFQYYRESY